MSNHSREYMSPPIGPVVSDPALGDLRMWCGPAAVSAITGSSYQAISQWLAHRGPKGRATPRGVRGTSTWEVQSALAQCGLDSWRVKRYHNKPPTLAEWLRTRTAEWRKATWILEVTGHWIVVKGNKMVDSHTKEPVFIRKAPHRRKRVHQAIVVNKPKGKRIAPIIK